MGTEKTWCGGVDWATGPGDVCQCAEPCPCWWWVQWWVWCVGRCSRRPSTLPAAHQCASVRSGVSWEDLYANDIVIIAESPEECVRRFLAWKEAMEEKGLRVNAGKTKIMICYTGLDLLQSKRVYIRRLSHWSGQQQHLLQALGAQEMQWAQALYKWHWLQQTKVKVGPDLLLPERQALSSRWLWTFNHNTCEKRLEEVQSCYQFPPPATSFKTRGRCIAQVRSAMLHASETWPLTKTTSTSRAEWQSW